MKSRLLNPVVLIGATFALLAIFAEETEAGIVKRSFVKLGCMGTYDKSDFAAMDRICEECYDLYREPGLHSHCRSYCFKNDYFNGCVKALLLFDQQPEIELKVNKLFGGT